MDENTIGREKFRELLIRPGAQEVWSQVVGGKLHAIIRVRRCRHLHSHNVLCWRDVALIGEVVGEWFQRIERPIVTDGVAYCYAVQLDLSVGRGNRQLWEVVSDSGREPEPFLSSVRGLALYRGKPLYVGLVRRSRANDRAYLYYENRRIWEAPRGSVAGIIVSGDEMTIHWEPDRHGRHPPFVVNDLSRFLGLRVLPSETGPYR